MFKDFQLSLYDFFGYFFPGLILTVSFLILSWPGNQNIGEYMKFDAEYWVFLVAVSYLVGHALQGFANACLNGYFEGDKYYDVGNKGIPDEIDKLIRTRIQRILGYAMHKLERKWVYQVCDRATVGEADGLRETYVYREGFYRGMFLATGVLAASFLIRCLMEVFTLPNLQDGWDIRALHLLLAAILSSFSVYFLYQRYLRFRGYRIHHALLGFLVQKETQGSGMAVE